MNFAKKLEVSISKNATLTLKTQPWYRKPLFDGGGGTGTPQLTPLGGGVLP